MIHSLTLSENCTMKEWQLIPKVSDGLLPGLKSIGFKFFVTRGQISWVVESVAL